LLLWLKFTISPCTSRQQSIHACIHYMLFHPVGLMRSMHMMFIGRELE
jgi:hypothetical protein